MTRPSKTLRAHEEAALILQVQASNSVALTTRTPRSAIGSITAIVLGALICAPMRRDSRRWYAEAECIVRCSRVVFSDEVAS